LQIRPKQLTEQFTILYQMSDQELEHAFFQDVVHTCEELEEFRNLSHLNKTFRLLEKKSKLNVPKLLMGYANYQKYMKKNPASMDMEKLYDSYQASLEQLKQDTFQYYTSINAGYALNSFYVLSLQLQQLLAYHETITYLFDCIDEPGLPLNSLSLSYDFKQALDRLMQELDAVWDPERSRSSFVEPLCYAQYRFKEATPQSVMNLYYETVAQLKQEILDLCPDVTIPKMILKMDKKMLIIKSILSRQFNKTIFFSEQIQKDQKKIQSYENLLYFLNLHIKEPAMCEVLRFFLLQQIKQFSKEENSCQSSKRVKANR